MMATVEELIEVSDERTKKKQRVKKITSRVVVDRPNFDEISRVATKVLVISFFEFYMCHFQASKG